MGCLLLLTWHLQTPGMPPGVDWTGKLECGNSYEPVFGKAFQGAAVGAAGKTRASKIRRSALTQPGKMVYVVGIEPGSQGGCAIIRWTNPQRQRGRRAAALPDFSTAHVTLRALPAAPETAGGSYK